MDRFKAYLKDNRGELTRIAAALGRFPSTLSQWERVPGEHMFAVSRLTGIPVEELRPDLVKGEEGNAA